MADITRNSFVESKRVIKKVLQQGRFLLDSDWNEQADILVTQRRRILSALLGDASARFGDGFKVVGTGASLQVTVKAGFAAFLIGTKLAELLQLAEDYTLSGFTAWTGARTDYVYLDLEEVEYDAADDPSIVNPAAGEETCRDVRLDFTFRISEGAPPGAAPSGHSYVNLATVMKTSGSNIQPGDVTVLLDEFSVTVDTEDIVDDAVTAPKINVNVAGTGLAQHTDGSLKIADGGVGPTQLATGAVTATKIAAGAVGESELATDAVTATKIAAGAVGQSELADDAVTKAKINADVAGTGLDQAGDGSLLVTGVKEMGANGAEIKMYVMEIGDWNMDADANKTLDCPVPAGNVRGCIVMIRSDSGTLMHGLTDHGEGDIQILPAGPWLELQREVAGLFDSANYDSTSYNRGWITIWYEA